MAGHNAEIVAEIDAFLLAEKFLYGEPPSFGIKRNLFEHQAKWPICNHQGVVGKGYLALSSRPLTQHGDAISLIYDGRPVCRVDMADSDDCHPNPIDAGKHGLPPIVCGPHFHPWSVNRHHALSSDGKWTTPYRSPLQPQIRRVDVQALPWFALQVNITILPKDRLFEFPRYLI